MDRLNTNIEIIVAFADYRDLFVAEIWMGNIHVAEVYIDEQKQKQVEIFFLKGRSIQISFNTLNEAAARLEPGSDREHS